MRTPGPSRASGLEPGWSAADITPYGPGYSRYVPGKGMLKVGYENHQYWWSRQTAPSTGTRRRGGFRDPGEAMRDADRVTDGLGPGTFEALTTHELLALYREIAQAYPQHTTGAREADGWHAELASVRQDVFGQLEIASLDPAYEGPDPVRFAQAVGLAFSGAVLQAMRASPNHAPRVAMQPRDQDRGEPAAPGLAGLDFPGAPTASPPASPGRHAAGEGSGITSRAGQARPRTAR